EIADALKLIPTPVDEVVNVVEEPQEEIASVQNIESNTIINDNVMSANINVNANVEQQPMQFNEPPKKVKSSLWNRIKNSKLVRAVKYAFRIKVVLQLPEALPEGDKEENR